MDTIEDSKALRKELDALGAPMPTGAAASVSDIEGRLKQTSTALAHAQEAQTSFWHNFVGGAAHHFKDGVSYAEGMKMASADSDTDVDAANANLKTGTHRLAQSQSIETDIKERAFTGGEDSVAIETIKNRFLQERAQIAEKVANGELASSAELIREAERRRDLDIRIEQRRQAAAAALTLEKEIVAIKESGLNVEVRIAEARAHAARKALRNGPESGDEHDKLVTAVDVSKGDVADARRTSTERKSQTDLETNIANLRGSSSQVHKATLDYEGADIARRLASTDTRADDRPGLEVRQARNRQQQDEFTKGEDLRKIDRQSVVDRAGAGRGLEDQIGLLTREMARNADRKEWNARENGGDKDTAAQLEATAAQLKKALEDVTFAEQQRLTALRTQGTDIANHGREPTLEQKNSQVDQRYDERITEERHGRNDPAAIAQMERNRDAEKLNNAVDEELMTPRQKRERAKQNARRDRAKANVESRERHHKEVQAANDSMDPIGARERHAHEVSIKPRDIKAEPSAKPGPHEAAQAKSLANIEKATATMAKNLDLGPGSKWFMDSDG